MLVSGAHFDLLIGAPEKKQEQGHLLLLLFTRLVVMREREQVLRVQALQEYPPFLIRHYRGGWN